MWPFEINETLERKLSFAVSTFPVCFVPQAADVHELSAALIGAHRDLVVRVQDHLAHAVWLQLRDQCLGQVVHSLSEEKYIKVIQTLVEIRIQRSQVRKTLQWVLVGVHEILEIHNFDLFDDIFPGLFKVLIGSHQLKLGMILLSSLYRHKLSLYYGITWSVIWK